MGVITEVFGLSKFLKALRGIFSTMSELTPEQRKELLFELDQTNVAIKSLAAQIDAVNHKLGGVSSGITNYVLVNVRKSPLGKHWEKLLQWTPSEFDLVKLSQDFMRLQGLVNKRDELEKKLGTKLV